MNIDIISTDKIALPAALLPAFKRWQRIDFTSDDVLLTEILQGAIEQFERNSEITVFKSTFIIEPESSEFCNGLLRLPITPVNSFQIVETIDAGTPHSDETFLSDDTGYMAPASPNGGGTWSVKARGIHGVRIYYLVGSFVDGMSVQIVSGYEPAALIPEIRQAVFQIAGHFYEYREIMNATNVGEPSMWLNQIMAGFWLPRA